MNHITIIVPKKKYKKKNRVIYAAHPKIEYQCRCVDLMDWTPTTVCHTNCYLNAI